MKKAPNKMPRLKKYYAVPVINLRQIIQGGSRYQRKHHLTQHNQTDGQDGIFFVERSDLFEPFKFQGGAIEAVLSVCHLS